MPRPVFLLGPTASGKHEAAVELARRLGGELISVDSMKVYRGMDVGTAKPTGEMRRAAPHHLIDICDPSEAYNAGRFVADARRAQADVESRGRRAVFVGGTALYYKAYMYGLFEGPPADEELRRELVAMGAPRLHEELSRVDPAAAERLHPNDLKRLVRAVEVYRKTGRPISAAQTQFDRPKLDAVVLCVRVERDALRRRIEERTRRMLAAGLVEEVRALLARPWGREGRQAVGYREVVAHLEGRLPIEEAQREIARNTWTLARRQMQWFRSFREVRWIDGLDVDRMEAECAS
ncbi:MAG: tRNA (adenosine(37)-N6)-dimethylallyltransferase MiaA [Planctomycetes bacterium]|nr:tRNA (adenosine(37)-N6)-dimethylallyltransferase MiaA [Planctomycetota bacterium]